MMPRTERGLQSIAPTKDTKPVTKGSLKWFQLKEKQWRESPRNKVVPLKPLESHASPSWKTPPSRPVNPSLTSPTGTPPIRPASQQPSIIGPFGSPQPVSTSKVNARSTADPDTCGYRERLIEFYQTHNPKKLDTVDETLVKYKGNEEEMFQKLQQKYVAGKDNMLQPSGSGPKCYLEFALDGKVLGRVDIQLFQDKAPLACENFRCLCTGEKGVGRSTKQLCYRGSKIHRIVPGFVIQGGDFTKGDGTGGESIYPPNSEHGDMWGKFKDEQPFLRHSRKGLLSMANNGPNTNGSQFFITLTAKPSLDGKHVVFGEVIAGLDVVDKLGTLETDQRQRPLKSVVIVDCGELGEDGAVISGPRSQQATYFSTTDCNNVGFTSQQPSWLSPTSGTALVPVSNSTPPSSSFGTCSLSAHSNPLGQGTSACSFGLNSTLLPHMATASQQASTPAGSDGPPTFSIRHSNAKVAFGASKTFAIESATSPFTFDPSASKVAGSTMSTFKSAESTTSSSPFGFNNPFQRKDASKSFGPKSSTPSFSFKPSDSKTSELASEIPTFSFDLGKPDQHKPDSKPLGGASPFSFGGNNPFHNGNNSGADVATGSRSANESEIPTFSFDLSKPDQHKPASIASEETAHLSFGGNNPFSRAKNSGAEVTTGPSLLKQHGNESEIPTFDLGRLVQHMPACIASEDMAHLSFGGNNPFSRAKNSGAEVATGSPSTKQHGAASWTRTKPSETWPVMGSTTTFGPFALPESTTSTTSVFNTPADPIEQNAPSFSCGQNKTANVVPTTLLNLNKPDASTLAAESTEPSFSYDCVIPSESVTTHSSTKELKPSRAESAVPSFSFVQAKPTESVPVPSSEKTKSSLNFVDANSTNFVGVSLNNSKHAAGTTSLSQAPATTNLITSARKPTVRSSGSKLTSPSPSKPALPSFYFGVSRPGSNISTACLSPPRPLFGSDKGSPSDIKRAKEVSEAVGDILAERVFYDDDLLSKVSVEQVETVMALPVDKKLEVLEYIDHLEDQGKTFTWEDIEVVSKKGGPFKVNSSATFRENRKQLPRTNEPPSRQGQNPVLVSRSEVDKTASIQMMQPMQGEDDGVLVAHVLTSGEDRVKAASTTTTAEKSASDEYATHSPLKAGPNVKETSTEGTTTNREQGAASLVARISGTKKADVPDASPPPVNNDSLSDEWVNVEEDEILTSRDQLNDEIGRSPGEELRSGWDDDEELLLLNLETLN